MQTKSVIEMSEAEIFQAISQGIFKLDVDNTHPDYLKKIKAFKPPSNDTSSQSN